MFSTPKNRYQAFAIHLFISAIIFIILAAIIICIWYPGFLFWADGGWQGMRLIAGVDFIIGPILTLMVYQLGKPGLKMDLFLIAMVQLSCLAIGCWLVYNERPLAMIYANGAFHTMSENSFDFHDHDSNSALSLDDKIPAWIYVDLPIEKEARTEILISQLQYGPVHARIDLYQPYQDNLQQIFKESIDLDTVDENTRNAVSENGKLYYFDARYSHSYIEIDKQSGEFIKLIKRPKKNKPVTEEEK